MNLSKENKRIKANFVKLHIHLRANTDKAHHGFLAKLFSEIGNDNYWFWRTLRRNIPRVYTYELREFYYLEQEWYNAYSIQERKKDEWLDFMDLKWKKEERAWDDFWSDSLIVGIGGGKAS